MPIISDQVLNHILRTQYPEVLELEFTASQIHCMAGNTKKQTTFEQVAKAIVAKSEIIKSLKERPGFSCRNLSAILNRSSCTCASVIDLLWQNRGRLEGLIGPGKFSATNIASMIGSSRSLFIKSIDALVENQDELLNLVGPGKFSSSNLSSILHGSSGRLPKAIKEVLNNQEGLLGLITSNQFSAGNVSSLFAGGGTTLGENIKALKDNQDDLFNLIGPDKFSVSNICSMLHKSAGSLGQTIKILCKNKAYFLELRAQPGCTKDVLKKELLRIRNETRPTMSAPQKPSLGMNNKTVLKIAALDTFFINNPDYAPLRALDFKRTHLTGISCSTTSAALFKKAAQALIENLPLIESIQKNTKLSIVNIVSILNQSKSKLGKVIQTLHKGEDTLIQLRDKLGFKPHHFSSILRAAGANLGSAIQALKKGMPTLIQLKNAGYNVDELSFSLSIDSPKNTSKTIKALAEVNKDILFIHEKDEELDLFLNKMINEFEPALRSAALKHKRPASSLLGGDQSFKKMRAF